MSTTKITGASSPNNITDRLNEIIDSVNNNINVLATSGTITLADNSVNTITPTGSVKFVLPTITDNTVLHRILVQINMTSVYSINIGTDKYFDKNDVNMAKIGTFNLYFEYDKANTCWVCKTMEKGTIPVGEVDKSKIGYATLLLNENNQLFACGRNDYGQQGDGTTNNVTYLRKIANNVSDFYAGGENNPNASDYVLSYLTSDGDLYMCGRNNYGQQGDGTTTDVNAFTKRASNVTSYSGNDFTTWYIDSDGDLYGCGYNGDGQQGSGNTTDVITFTKRASSVSSVSASMYYTCYITTSGDLYVNNSSNVFALVAQNVSYAIAGLSGGVFYINSSGYLYQYTKTSGSTQLATSVSSVAVGVSTPASIFYITTGKDLYGKGANGYGQQGNGTTTDVGSFAQIASNVASVSCSGCTSFYITTSGDLYACGRNDGYQQGNGTTTNVTSFTKIASNIASVQANYWTTSYLTTSGDVYFCGYNSYGQVANGSTETITTFTQVK